MRGTIRLLLLILCLTVTNSAIAQSFYQGKVLRILVPSAAGSLTDIEARVVARHISRHIPGEPGVIIQAYLGAGGINLANYL